MNKVKVLLVGMNYMPNQFSRALARYPEVVVIHETGDPGSKIRLDCDAAFICIAHCSHGKFYTAKDEYKKAGKAIFVARHGFSETKDSFEEWLDSRVFSMPTVTHIPKPPTAIEVAMQEALKKQQTVALSAPIKTEPIVAKEKEMSNQTFPRNPKRDPRYVWVANFILIRHAAGDSAATISKKLTAMGSLTYGMNKPWTAGKINSTVYNLRKTGFQVNPEIIRGEVPDYVAVAKKEQKVKSPPKPQQDYAPKNDTKALAQLVLDTDGLTREQKLDLLKVLI